MGEGIDVVRTTRLEVIDHKGRVRVVIGTLTDERDDDDMVGVSIRDARGSERLYLVTDEKTADAGATGSGNNLAGLRVDERESVSLFVAGPDGTVARSWPE